MKYRDTVLALAVEMWRPLGFCSLRSGCQNMIMILGFGVWVHGAPGTISAFRWIICSGGYQTWAQGARGFHEEGSWGSPTGWGIVDFQCDFIFWVRLTSMHPHRLDFFFRTQCFPVGVCGLLWIHFFDVKKTYSGLYFERFELPFYMSWIVKCVVRFKCVSCNLCCLISVKIFFLSLQ